ncbi:AsmA-like C-terminal region-containing protein [Owenweeksia hongkongensis]|uniref:AsmA-like C-terminal region-containing protein n=1 Tax=Owenweeksia hongkongensis TaxID=253245 RepID=UPI003A94E8E4
MKRLFQVLGTLILLVVAAAIILPIVFKDEIIARAKEEMNKNLTATVDFKDIDISLFRSFPDFALTLEETTVDGKGIFEGTRLAEIGSFNVDLNLYSVISGNTYEIEGIQIKDAIVHVVVDTSGAANYDIVKASEEEEEEVEETTEESSSFKLNLKGYELENFNLIYDDRPGAMAVHIKNLNHTGSGDFTEVVVNLTTKTTIDALTFDYEGVAYLSKTKVDADINVAFDQEAFKITFQENKVALNDLALKFDGWVLMPEDDIDMDLSFDAPDNNFKSVLSLIPAVYAEDFASVKTTGDFNLKGMAKGKYSDDPETYPAFDLVFNINNATFRYPDLPAGVDGINVKAHIFNKTSDLDGMVIDVPTASAVVAGSPINASLNLKTPMSDPQIAMFVKTDFDLANVAKVVPASGFDYSGRVKADLDLATRMSDIDNERYENVKAEGNLLIEGMTLRSDSLPYDVALSKMEMAFSPQYVDLKAFDSKIGKSDIAANGRIDNLLGYALEDQTLKANFNITSNLLDLNELSGSSEEGAEETATETTEAESALEVIRLPENVDATLTASLQKVIYDNLEIERVNGTIALKDGAASMTNVNMEMLGGGMQLDGVYDSKPAAPEVDFKMNIKNFSFKESFEKFITVQKMAPIMENTTGTYGTELNFASKLNPDMSPDLATVNAGGKLVANNMTTSPEAMKKLADMLKNDKLSTLDLGNVNLSYKIQDGRVNVDPFDIKAGDVTAKVSGSNGLDQTLDYTMDMKIPTSGIKANALLEQFGATSGGKLDLKVLIGGTVQDPKVTTDLGNLAGNVIDNLKDQAKEKVEEVKKEAIDKANAEAQKLIDEAEKKGDELIAKAQEAGDKLKAEAKKQADNIRAEGKKNAQKARDEGKGNPLKKLAADKAGDEIEKKANEAAKKVEDEANKQANSLLNEAKKQKEELVKNAREEAKIEGGN